MPEVREMKKNFMSQDELKSVRFAVSAEDMEDLQNIANEKGCKTLSGAVRYAIRLAAMEIDPLVI